MIHEPKPRMVSATESIKQKNGNPLVMPAFVSVFEVAADVPPPKISSKRDNDSHPQAPPQLLNINLERTGYALWTLLNVLNTANSAIVAEIR